MNREFFDLRDKEFRDYIIKKYYRYSNLGLSLKNEMDLVSLLKKDEINDNDLIQLYLISGNVLDIFLFDYKMSIISEEEIDKFLEIVNKEAGIFIRKEFDMGGFITYDALSYWMSIGKLNKLVEKFLDGI